MSTLNVSNISDGTDTVETGYVVNGSAKAWVNLNGSGTIAVRDSLNISTVTDIAEGNYRYNYTSSFAAPNYSVVGGGNANNNQSVAMPQEGQDVLVGSVSVVFLINNGSSGDAPTACAQMHGDLA